MILRDGWACTYKTQQFLQDSFWKYFLVDIFTYSCAFVCAFYNMNYSWLLSGNVFVHDGSRIVNIMADKCNYLKSVRSKLLRMTVISITQQKAASGSSYALRLLTVICCSWNYSYAQKVWEDLSTTLNMAFDDHKARYVTNTVVPHIQSPVAEH